MISGFLREQKRYTQKDLCSILKCSEEKIVPLIRKLKEYGVLKAVKATMIQKELSDLVEDDIEVAEVEIGEDEYYYVFTFVGIIVAAGRVFKCYPKYLLNATEPKEEMRQIIKVLEKYNSKEQIIRMFNDSDESRSFNLLAVILFLLNDYYENGSYSNMQEIIESNGSGEVLWDKTINETFMLIVNNRPYYTDLQTKKRINDDFDFFKRLHECVITLASKELKEADLLELFEITETVLSDEVIADFGEKDYILDRIEKELNVQFNTRKQLVLKTMYAYIVHSGNLNDIDAVSLFGTNSFNLVWEKVCAEIMDNQLNTPIGQLHMPVPLQTGYDKRTKLIDLIEKPLWTVTGITASDTFIPDLISINDNQFIIFDAKYYNAMLEPGKPPKAQPGIESITKQYLYQLAYRKFISAHGFAAVRNCFLMPTEQQEIVDKGEVSMEMFKVLALEPIKARLLPAREVFDCYLCGKKMDISKLNL